MLNSTAHWKPLVNGYSDHIPSAFSTRLPVLADFPTAASFDTLPVGVRYAIFHLDGYKGRLHEDARWPATRVSLQIAPALR